MPPSSSTAQPAPSGRRTTSMAKPRVTIGYAARYRHPGTEGKVVISCGVRLRKAAMSPAAKQNWPSASSSQGRRGRGSKSWIPAAPRRSPPGRGRRPCRSEGPFRPWTRGQMPPGRSRGNRPQPVDRHREHVAEPRHRRSIVVKALLANAPNVLRQMGGESVSPTEPLLSVRPVHSNVAGEAPSFAGD